MGACASVPKDLKKDEAPAPEPAQEETIVKAVENVEEVKDEQDKPQSLETLLHEGEVKKEESEEKKASKEVVVKPKEDEEEQNKAEEAQVPAPAPEKEINEEKKN